MGRQAMTVSGDEPFVESAKAVQEVAKTTGKGIDAAREAGGFIARFIAGPLEQGVGVFEDKLVYSRWERRQRYMLQVLRVQQELGLAPPDRAVPLKIAIPLFQGASIEEDDNLQDQWVSLLINAAYEGGGVEVKRVYVEILSQISPLEAKIFNIIYALPFNQIQYNGVITADLPTGVQVGANEDTQHVEPNDEIKDRKSVG